MLEKFYDSLSFFLLHIREVLRKMKFKSRKANRRTAEKAVDGWTFTELDGKQHERLGNVDESFANKTIEVSYVARLSWMHCLQAEI